MQFPPQQPQVAFGLPYLLVELFYIGMSVVRTDGRTVTWLPKFLGWVDYHIFLGWGSSAIIKCFLFFFWLHTDAKLIRTLLLFPGIVPQWLRSDRIGLFSFHFRISKSRAFPSVFFCKKNPPQSNDTFHKSELVGKTGHIEKKILFFFSSTYHCLAYHLEIKWSGWKVPINSGILLKTGLVWPGSSDKCGKRLETKKLWRAKFLFGRLFAVWDSETSVLLFNIIGDELLLNFEAKFQR